MKRYESHTFGCTLNDLFGKLKELNVQGYRLVGFFPCNVAPSSIVAGSGPQPGCFAVMEREAPEVDAPIFHLPVQRSDG